MLQAKFREPLKICGRLGKPNAKLRDAPDSFTPKLNPEFLARGCNFAFSTKAGDLDAIGHVEPLGDYGALLKKEEYYMIGELRFRTISLEDLLKVKLHINRPKDQESIAQLLAIKRIRNETS